MKRLVTFIAISLLTCFSAVAQPATISGSVKNEKGEPISGANIIVKGTFIGTLVDAKGRFEIKADIGQTLVCSFVGFTSQEQKIEGTTLNFVISEDATQLDQVIVVGYGSAKKGDITGAVSSIKMDDVAEMPASNSIMTNLQGRIAGLQVVNSGQGPGSSASKIIIRGISSLRGTQSPLVVLDGFPLGEGADLKQINPADIEDIVVLKDASSTSIYGSRGANGVIMVTSKKAKKGETKVTFSHQTNVSQFSSEIDMWRNPILMAQLDNESRTNAGQLPLYVGRTDNGVYYPSIQELEDGSYPHYTRWDDVILRTPVTNTTSVGVSGATDRLTYNLSANYFDDRGVYLKDSYEKLGLSLDVSYKLFKNFTIKSSNLFSKNWRNAASGNIGRNPLYPIYDENGDYFKSNINDFDNPLARINNIKNKSNGMDVISSFLFDWEIIPGLSWKNQINYKYGSSVTDQYNSKKYTESGYFNNGHGYIGNWADENITYESYMNYDHTFDNNSTLSAMVGYSYTDYRDRTSAMNAYDFANEALANENMSAGNPSKNTISNGFNNSKLISYYGKVNYSLLDRYLFTATFRSDGSSKFGANNRWSYFPSGAFAWKLHNEEFMKNITFINQAKLRASYGLSGNQGIPAYTTLSRYGIEKYYQGGQWNTVIGPGFVTGSYGSNGRFKYWGGIPNKDLKWETTTQLNLGIDLGLLNNRLRFTFDWYDKHTRDLLRESYLPLSSGYDKIWVNDGKLRNRGYEISLAADIVDKNDIYFGATFIYSSNKSKVMSLGNAQSSGLLTDPNTGMQFEFYGSALDYNPVGIPNILAVGQPLNVFYGYRTNGIVQTHEEGVAAGLVGDEARPGEYKYMNINNDNVVDDRDRTVIGDPNPDFISSLNLNFRYKNFDVSVFLNGVFGNDILYQYGFTSPSTSPLRWTLDNPTNQYPSLRNNRTPKVSDWFVRDGSFVRIQDINIGYSFRNPFKYISNIRIYGTINNLYTFTSFKGYDPEMGIDGIYWGGYPRFRKFSIGLNIVF